MIEVLGKAVRSCRICSEVGQSYESLKKAGKGCELLRNAFRG